MASPTAERRASVLVGDGRPQFLSALALSAHRGQRRAEPDAEHASGAITDLLGEHEALACLHLCFVGAAGLQGEGRQLGEQPALPPANTRLARHREADRDELVRARLVPGVALDRTERADGLRLAPAVAGALVDSVALGHELAGAREVSAAHGADAEAMKENRSPVLVTELLEELEALLPEPLGGFVFAGDVVGAPVGAQGTGANGAERRCHSPGGRGTPRTSAFLREGRA